MIAHTSIPVSDYRRSKAFYLEVLKPLGYSNNMEFGEAAGFNDGKNTDFWISHKDTVEPAHLAFEAKSADEVRAFHKAALAAGRGRDAPRPLQGGRLGTGAFWPLRGASGRAMVKE